MPKPKKGNAAQAAKGLKKVEVWLEPEAFVAFERLCAQQGRTKAKMLRRLVAYVNKGGVTAIEILHGVATDRAAK